VAESPAHATTTLNVNASPAPRVRVAVASVSASVAGPSPGEGGRDPANVICREVRAVAERTALQQTPVTDVNTNISVWLLWPGNTRAQATPHLHHTTGVFIKSLAIHAVDCFVATFDFLIVDKDKVLCT
jgi:hypothetical protein